MCHLYCQCVTYIVNVSLILSMQINHYAHVCIVTVLKTNVHNNDMCLINFSTYLFSCVKFFWIQLILKIYYRQEFPNVLYIIASVFPVLNTRTKQYRHF